MKSTDDLPDPLDEPIVLLDEEDEARAAAEPEPTLFRREVLAERQTQWLGTVLLAPRLSHRVFTLFAVLVVAGVVALFQVASYGRTARVGGWLVPRAGVVQVFAPAPGGLATEVKVVEGQRVARGDPLVVLSPEGDDTPLGAGRAQAARGLAERRACLARERAAAARLLEDRTRGLARRLATVREELDGLARELEVQRARARLALRGLERARALRAAGLATEQEEQAAEEARLEPEAQACALQRARASLEREALALEAERDELPLRAQAEDAALAREDAALVQALAEVEARRELVVPAPVDGTITGLQVVRGGPARPDLPLLTILPAGDLEAHLFTPGRAVGLLRPGQRVRLRYEAFPWQRFGHHEGVVLDVPRAAENPAEVAQLAGLTALFEAGEPLYRVRVRLARQVVLVEGRPVALQPGLQLEADVVIDRRRLLDWALDPLRGLVGGAE